MAPATQVLCDGEFWQGLCRQKVQFWQSRHDGKGYRRPGFFNTLQVICLKVYRPSVSLTQQDIPIGLWDVYLKARVGDGRLNYAEALNETDGATTLSV